MEADAPQVWERDHRKLIMPPRRRRNGRSIEVSRKFLDRSRGLHAKANPAAGPATYPGPSTRTWSWNGGGGPQAWKLGSPGLERGHQPEEFDHARRPLPGWAMPWDSWQGEPGVVKEVPHLRGRQRGTDAGTKVEGPARGSWDHRAQKNGNQPDQAPSLTPQWPRLGGGCPTGAFGFTLGSSRQSSQAENLPHLRGCRRTPVDAHLEREWTWISNDRRPQVWKRGSPEPERGDQPDHPQRQAPVKQQLFHKVPRREVRVPLPLLSSPEWQSSTLKARSLARTAGALRQVPSPT